MRLFNRYKVNPEPGFRPQIRLGPIAQWVIGVRLVTGQLSCEHAANSVRALPMVSVAANGHGRPQFRDRWLQEQFREFATEAETRFDAFEPELGEEELTTKHYEMPNGKYHITASVFYTDENLRLPAEELPMESVMIGIVVSDQRHEDAFSIAGNAASETAYSKLSIAARVKQRVALAGLEYLVGMECQFAESYDSLSRALRVLASGDAPDSENPPRQPPPRPPNP